jgi:mono/diheme cytochrome c family protein
MPRFNSRHIPLTIVVLALVGASLAAQRRTVWDGVYTAAEATRGADAYQATCAGCHRPDLSGDGTVPALSGESFTFQWADATVGDLFKRIRTAMPPDRPDSLPPEVYRDIVAYVLQSNKMPPGEVELDPDADQLQQIVITAAPR